MKIHKEDTKNIVMHTTYLFLVVSLRDLSWVSYYLLGIYVHYVKY